MNPRLIFFLLLFMAFTAVHSQDRMTPELLWSLNRVSAVGLTEDGQTVVFSVTRYDVRENASSRSYFQVPLQGGIAQAIDDYQGLIRNPKLSPDGKFMISSREVKVKPIAGVDFYPELDKSNALIYDNLNYRHWDQWEDGKYGHVFVQPMEDGKPGEGWDIMAEEPYDCPQQPFGGPEDFIWNHEGSQVLYVTKKKYGTEYTTSTNTDIFAYDLATKTTSNLTDDNPGYDTHPAFSKDGRLAWLQMKEDGYESDKNDIIVRIEGVAVNLTQGWDGTVYGFLWGNNGDRIYFNAPLAGTVQVFEVVVPKKAGAIPKINQITEGQFNINSLVGQSDNTLVVSRSDMNHAAELYTLNLKKGEMQQLTHANDSIYNRIKRSKIEKRMVPTTDGKQMLTWVIYPPDFDPSKRYPTLLYCQGGPQAALSQF